MNSKLPSSNERFSSEAREVMDPFRLDGMFRVNGDGGIELLYGLLDDLGLWFSRSSGELCGVGGFGVTTAGTSEFRISGR